MKILILISTLAVGFAGLANASDYDRSKSPEVVEKTYRAMAYLEHEYEIGKSTLHVSVDCQISKEAAEKAIATEVSQIQSLVDAFAAKFDLGKQDEFWGYDLNGDTITSPDDPISLQFDATKNRNLWTDRCTKKQFQLPVHAVRVFKAEKVISVWFPNKKTLLSEVPDLVNTLEARSNNNAPQGVRIVNQSGGQKFALGVTKSTEEALWKEIKATASQRAAKKRDADFAKTKYTNVWQGPEVFTKGEGNSLATPHIVKENGKWIARFTSPRQFTVYTQQASEPETGAGLLSSVKTYSVEGKAESKEGLYGKLIVTVTQDCVPIKDPKDAKKEAETRIEKDRDFVLEKMRAINQDKNTETDRLEVSQPEGDIHSSLVPYTQYIGPKEDLKTVTYYYDKCTLEIHEVSVMPKDEVAGATQTLTILSSDLEALTKLRDELAGKYTRETDDPREIKVTASWTGTATLDVLESLDSKADIDAFAKFMARGSDFQCDASRFAFACLSQPRYTLRGGGDGYDETPDGSKFRSFPATAAAGPGGAPPVRQSERGVATFQGVDTINVTVRRVLVDNQRK